jgi:peptidoglycan/LPS O-acetylase OafA/YrhL
MVSLRWTVADGVGTPFRPAQLWLWAFPLATPPYSSAGAAWVQPLWFITTWLWLLLLSPALVWLFRRWPLRVAALPVTLVALLSTGLLTIDDGDTRDVLTHLGVFTCCWLVGVAHHDRRLQRSRLCRILPLGAALLGAGLWSLVTHPVPEHGLDLSQRPLSDLLYQLGAVLVLLRLRPGTRWLGRVPGLRSAVGLLPRWTLTIYLWSAFALGAVPVGVRRLGATGPDDGVRGRLLACGVAALLVAAVVVLAGWLEELAAGRRPTVLPRLRGRAAPPPEGRTVLLEGNVASAADAGRRDGGGGARADVPPPDPLPGRAAVPQARQPGPSSPAGRGARRTGRPSTSRRPVPSQRAAGGRRDLSRPDGKAGDGVDQHGAKARETTGAGVDGPPAHRAAPDPDVEPGRG